VKSRLWYRGLVCDAVIGTRQIPMLIEHFADALKAAGWPHGACLFLTEHRLSKASQSKDDSAVPEAVFFSPAAIAAVPHLIAVWGAEPSPPPDREYATLLVGTLSDWDLLPQGLH
jgi:hypothetical protein